ncbi:MAG: hypothetical protein HQL81_01040 [Magnetococcales bacterium]|nr:hypothetical protein [Magnetococcales bacterium]
MVMSRFEQSEGETAAFVTGTFLDLKEFDCLNEHDKATVRTFIKETIHSQLSCCRKGLWEQFQEWIPGAIRRMAQRHIHPVVPGEKLHGYRLPESIQHDFEILDELAWLLTWKHKKCAADGAEEERNGLEHPDVERARRIREQILPLLEEKIVRLVHSATEAEHKKQDHR